MKLEAGLGERELKINPGRYHSILFIPATRSK